MAQQEQSNSAEREVIKERIATRMRDLLAQAQKALAAARDP